MKTVRMDSRLIRCPVLRFWQRMLFGKVGESRGASDPGRYFLVVELDLAMTGESVTSIQHSVFD